MKKNVFVNNPSYDKGADDREKSEFLVYFRPIWKSKVKPILMDIIEQAFRKYCKAHGADIGLEDLEWKRFQKILNEML
jgi:hypothetical protein